MSYGATEFDHRGASIYHFDKKSRRRLERELGREALRQLEQLTGLYAVVAEDGKVITAGHRLSRIFSDRKPASRADTSFRRGRLAPVSASMP